MGNFCRCFSSYTIEASIILRRNKYYLFDLTSLELTVSVAYLMENKTLIVVFSFINIDCVKLLNYAGFRLFVVNKMAATRFLFQFSAPYMVNSIIHFLKGDLYFAGLRHEQVYPVFEVFAISVANFPRPRGLHHRPTATAPSVCPI